MQATGRLWRALAVGAFLAGAGILVGRPILVAGALSIAAWVVAHQVGFLVELRALLTGLDVHQSLEPDRVQTDEESTLALGLSTPNPSPLSVRLDPRLPAGLTYDAAPDGLELAAGTTSAESQSLVTSPVAGEHTIDAPQATITASEDLIRTTATLGTPATLTIEPRAPRNIHVGQAGEAFGAAWGDHAADSEGTGLDPAELRQYVPGDPARRIDWKATARLDEAHVREFEAETDRRLFLVVDARAPMTTGRAAETKLDYLREIGLGYIERSRANGDPLGLATLDEEGIHERLTVQATEGHYGRARTMLRELQPTDAAGSAIDLPLRTTPDAAHRTAQRLAADDTAFGRTLTPYVEDTAGYLERVADNPLVTAVRSMTDQTSGSVWTVLLTDDNNPAEVREAVTLARRRDRRVLVFLTPTVLFDPGGLADLEGAHDRYLEFEELRRELDGLSKVSAYEVGPGDRFAAVLGRSRATTDRVEGA